MTPSHLHLDATAYPPGTRHPPHAHGELHLSLVLRGEISERVGTRTESASALSVVAKDPGVTHADDFGTSGAVMVRLAIANRALGDLSERPADAPFWRWTHDPAVAAPFLHIATRGQQGEVRFPIDDNDVADLLAALTARPAAPARGAPPEWLRVAMIEMRDAWVPSLAVRDVARTAGVHPVYLARSIRRWYGVGAGEALRRIRMLRAARALTRPGTTVSTAAHTTGFADEPHLCREFARATGVTPGRFRRLVRDAEITGLHRVAARG